MGIDPGTLAIISLASSVISGAGGLMQGMGQSQAQNYNAQIAAQNAQVAKQNAIWATQAGEAQASAQEQKTRATVGAIKAAQAAGNIDVNTGSAVDVRSSAAELGELDAITIRSNAAREAYGYQVQATGFENQSQLDKFAAQDSQLAGFTTFLGGMGSAASNWLKFQQSGLLTAPGVG